MRTSSAKAKGRRCSQELKDALLKAAPQLQDGDIVVTSAGTTGPDLQLSPLAETIYPFAIECKNVEKLNIHAALEQASTHVTKPHHKAVLAFKRNRTGIFIALSLEDFLQLYHRKDNSI